MIILPLTHRSKYLVTHHHTTRIHYRYFFSNSRKTSSLGVSRPAFISANPRSTLSFNSSTVVGTFSIHWRWCILVNCLTYVFTSSNNSKLLIVRTSRINYILKASNSIVVIIHSTFGSYEDNIILQKNNVLNLFHQKEQLLLLPLLIFLLSQKPSLPSKTKSSNPNPETNDRHTRRHIQIFLSTICYSFH